MVEMLVDRLSVDPDSPLGAPRVATADWFRTLPDGYDPVNVMDQPVIWIGQTDDQLGRFASLVAPYGECLINRKDERAGVCWTAPKSATGYQWAYGGKQWPTLTGLIPAATIAAGLPHANESWTPQARVSALDNTTLAVAKVQYHDIPEKGGIFALGVLLPHVTVWDAVMLGGFGLSGEWFRVPGLANPEMAAAIVVNEQAFRRRPKMSKGRATYTASIVADDHGPLLVVGSWTPTDTPVSDTSVLATAPTEGTHAMPTNSNPTTVVAAFTPTMADPLHGGAEATDTAGGTWYVVDDNLSLAGDPAVSAVTDYEAYIDGDRYPASARETPTVFARTDLTPTGNVMEWHSDPEAPEPVLVVNDETMPVPTVSVPTVSVPTVSVPTVSVASVSNADVAHASPCSCSVPVVAAADVAMVETEHVVPVGPSQADFDALVARLDAVDEMVQALASAALAEPQMMPAGADDTDGAVGV